MLPWEIHSSVQFSSVTQSSPTLCNPMNHSTPGLPVHHQLLQFTQTHVHRVGDAIQPSHPLLSPSPPAFSLSNIRVCSNESALHIRCPKYWSFSFNIKTAAISECQVCPGHHSGCFVYTVSLYSQNFSKIVSGFYRQGKLSH